MTSPKFRLFFRLFSPFSVKNQEKASLIHKKQTSTAKKEGKTPQKNRKFSHRRKKKRGKKKRVRAQKTGNARPKKKKKRPKRREKRRTKAQKMQSPPKKIKKSLETPAFSPNFNGFFRILPRVCCIFTPSAPCFAVFLRCFCLVHCCFFFLFALFRYSFSVFSLFLYGFWLFFPLFLYFSPFKASAAPCARFFGVWFSFFGFLSTSSLFFCRFCSPQSRIHLKNPLFYPFLCFLFLFFCLHDRLSHRFFAFSCFFLRLSAFAEEKSKIRRFHLSNSKKSCEQRKRRRRKAKTGSAGRENAVKKGKSALRAGTISQKISVFLPKNLTKERLSSNSRECFM